MRNIVDPVWSLLQCATQRRCFIPVQIGRTLRQTPSQYRTLYRVRAGLLTVTAAIATIGSRQRFAREPRK